MQRLRRRELVWERFARPGSKPGGGERQSTSSRSPRLAIPRITVQRSAGRPQHAAGIWISTRLKRRAIAFDSAALHSGRVYLRTHSRPACLSLGSPSRLKPNAERFRLPSVGGLHPRHRRGSRLETLVEPMQIPRMSTRRMAVVIALLCFVSGGMVHEIVNPRERWPFSNYAMHSVRIPELQTKTFVAVGISRNGKEVPSAIAFDPFRPRLLHFALKRQHKNGTLSEAAEQLLLVRPQLDGVRIYRYHHSPSGSSYELMTEAVR